MRSAMASRTMVITTALVLFLAIKSAQGACDPAVRTFDGSCNNLAHPDRGKFGTALSRGAEGVGYVDGYLEPRAGPNERDVSNMLGEAESNMKNKRGRTVKFAFEGQWIAHDIAGTRVQAEKDQILILDPQDPLYSKSLNIPPSINISRSALVVDEGGVGQIINDISHWIDLSQIYGSNKTVCDALRSFSGGRLLTSSYDITDLAISPHTLHLDNQLPNSATVNIPVDMELAGNNPPESHLISGDFRAIENAVLAMNHLTWVRRHNSNAGRVALANPGWTDEQVFQKARHRTIGEYQHIVFDEYMRALVGEAIYSNIEEYDGYNADADGRVSVLFATSAFRFGHSLIPKNITLVDYHGNVYGSLAHASLFHGHLNPLTVNLVTGGPGKLALALVRTGGDDFDEKFSETMRDMPDPFDIMAANLYRGRANGLPAFDRVYQAYNPDHHDLYDRPACAATAPPSTADDSIACFDYLTNDAQKAATLRTAYGKLSRVDPYVAFLCQKPVADSMLGLTHTEVVVQQFLALRSGDRWWYQNTENGALTEQEVADIRGTTYADILHEELDIPRAHLQNFVFFSPEAVAVAE